MRLDVLDWSENDEERNESDQGDEEDEGNVNAE